MLTPDMLTGHRCAPTATTPIILILAHLMGTTVRSGLWAEYSSVLDLGITGDMTDTGAVRGIGVTAMDAKAGATSVEESTRTAAMDAAMRMVVTSAALPLTMDAAVTDAATREVMASMAEAPSAVAAKVVSTVELDSTVAAVGEASMAEADPTVADTGNATIEA
jgi:hypothetical protein